MRDAHIYILGSPERINKNNTLEKHYKRFVLLIYTLACLVKMTVWQIFTLISFESTIRLNKFNNV